MPLDPETDRELHEALAFASNEQLIRELLSRSTFRGMVTYQLENFKGSPKSHWRWECAHCDLAEVVRDLYDQLPH